MTATKSLLGQVRIDMNDLHTTVELLASTNEEMQRQEVLWGMQSHPLIGECGIVETLRWSYRCQAEEWKRTNDARSDLGEDGWDGILAEQLDSRNRPCNFVELMPRLLEK